MEFDLEIDKASVALLVSGIFLGSLGGLYLSGVGSSGGSELVGFLENQTDQELEMVRSEDAGRFTKVDLRTSDDRLVTYYVSVDGERYTRGMNEIDSIRQRRTRVENLAQCLRDSETVMFGNLSQRATRAQIQAVGGIETVQPIYQDVSSNQTLAQAVRLGVEEVPAFYNNGSAIQGLSSIDEIENLAKC